MKLNKIKLRDRNPRFIKDDKFKKLVKSIKEFPKMMELRPIIIDDENVILGGNMRYRALVELKIKDVPDEWVKKASELTEEQKKEFVAKDNIGFGEWDFDLLAEDYDIELLDDWGLDIPNMIAQDIDIEEDVGLGDGSDMKNIMIKVKDSDETYIRELIEQYIFREYPDSKFSN